MKKSTKFLITSITLLIMGLAFILVWKKSSSFGIVLLAFGLGYVYKYLQTKKEEKIFEEDDD